MTENYKIILSESELLRFIDWLPQLDKSEIYYLCLFARKKYALDDSLNAQEVQIKRLTADKNYMFSRIKQMQCEIGSYTYKGLPIPPETLALYINPNPRCLEATAKKALTKLSELVTKPYSGYNPHQEILSIIQTSYKKKRFVNLDFDLVSIEDTLNTIKEQDIINESCLHVIKTRGGFHLLIEITKINPIYSKTWYRKATALPGVDLSAHSSDGLMPVPGCVQGGFSPYIFTKTEVVTNPFSLT